MLRKTALTCIALTFVACNLPAGGGSAATQQESGPENEAAEASEEAEARPVLNVPRIAIRTLDGVAEFYNTETGEEFVPRGVNYVDFYETSRDGYEDRVMATNVYDPERVRAAFRHLAEYGYNTARIFFDTCGFGPYCIGNPNGRGLNPGYLDNMVDLMRIAGEEGIYIVFTANSIPEEGRYWQQFDSIFNRDGHEGFQDANNADWLHAAGVAIKEQFWSDLMSGMVERDAPFATVLGWQLTNEFWLFKNIPPLSLDEGLVTTANGATYDMSDPDQKSQMVADGTLYFMETIVPIIKEHDPEALTTMGFFAPQFPNPTGIGGDWYVDTASLLDSAPVDFWDFHAYSDTDLDIRGQAENFGIIGYEEKPVLMGETGSGKAYVPSAYSGLDQGLRWIAASCEVGFDGWLNWGYYPWPDEVNGAPWTFLDSGEVLLHGMAPVNQPDACVVPDLEATNVAFGKPARATGQTPSEPASNAVDGGQPTWSAGDYPPQWIEVDLEEPTTIQRVGMTVAQWPPGDTRHQVWARLSSDEMVLLAEIQGYTTIDMALGVDLPVALQDVVAVRIQTLSSPSWAGWGEIEVISAPQPEQQACLLRASGSVNLYADPEDTTAAFSTLSAGQLAYAAGQHEASDGSLWYHVAPETWALSAEVTPSGDCDALPAVDPDANPTVPVTFSVTVPPGPTPEVFIGGFFPGTPYPAWIPYAIFMTRQGGGVWTVTLDLPVGADIEYIYNRNSWETVERPENCGETIPRTFTVEAGEGMLIEDEVVKWRDRDCE